MVMENTPDKNQSSASYSSSSLSKFDNSPVFDYISNLSPIVPAKSTHVYHIFNSPTLVSPSSLFNSPQPGPHRESRFALRRHLCSDISKSELSLGINENHSKEAASQNAHLSYPVTEPVEFLTPGGSVIEGRPNFDLVTEPEQTLKYKSDFMADYFTDIGPRMLAALSPPLGPDKDSLKERKPLFERELHLRKICRIQKNDWWTSITELADHLISDSSNIEENMDENDRRPVDPGTVSLMSAFSDILQSHSDDLKIIESTDLCNSSKQSEMGRSVTESKETCNMNATDQTTAILSGNPVSKLVVSDPTTKVATEQQQQQRVRRRCLHFEMAGACKNKLIHNSNCNSSTLLPSGSKVEYTETHLGPNETESYKPPNFAGFGLHLNELATASKDDRVYTYNENRSPGIQLMYKSLSIKSSVPEQSNQDSSNNYLHSNSMTIVSDDENEAVEAATHTSADTFHNEPDQNSPEKKRRKFEDAGASQDCKRCNCRRSKCLKLYCECFAAGLYCIEPCSCQGCFNKPAHVDVVMETRRLIEARNPIAFAPKVLLSSATVPESGDETNKTPASARHKRGCNCKKSSCLKKYCECFQGGVGCCSSCRCEGCRNKFGRKNDADEIVYEAEDIDSSSCEIIARNVEEEDPNLPIIPRSPVQKQHPIYKNVEWPYYAEPSTHSSSHLKLNRSKSTGCEPHFKVHLQAIPEDEKPEIPRIDEPPTKLASPTTKRILPPHPTWNSNRKLGLRSIRPFPSLNSS